MPDSRPKLPWVNSPPTRPGPYWHKDTPNGVAEIFDVTSFAGVLRVDFPCEAAEKVEEIGGFWQGPLTPDE